MANLTKYYRVDLTVGIVIEPQKTGFYSNSPELGVTVFKNLRAAKRKFDEITQAEVARIRALRKTCRATKSRKEFAVVAPNES